MKLILNILYFILFFASHFMGASGQTHISGFVRDRWSQEALIGAHITNQSSRQTLCTDNNGYFQLVATQGTQLHCSFIGYEPYVYQVTSRADTMLHVHLQPGTELEAIEISAHQNEGGNVATLTAQEMKLLPSLGATPDLMKSLQMHPGIQSLNEGSSLLLVRGGNPGENLYLLDQTPLIYVNHLGGFFSIFNPEVINKVSTYKGAFPPSLGGKLSSVVDITQREGAYDTLKGSCDLGITGVGLTLEGPLQLKNATFLISGRKTLTEPLYYGLCTLLDDNFNIVYGFHDVNAKISWKPNANNSYYLNFYQGDDYLHYWSVFKENNTIEKSRHTNIWGNWMLALRWNRIMSSNLFMTSGISYTRYRLKDVSSIQKSTSVENTGSRYRSSVQDYRAYTNFKYTPLAKWTLNFGLQTNYLIHEPNQLINNQAPESVHSDRTHSLNPAFYLNNTLTFFNLIELQLGTRITSYFTDNFMHFTPEPRASIQLNIAHGQYISGSYMQVTQHSHLLFTPHSFANNEIWIPAGSTIAPSWSEQYTIGWDGYFQNKKYTMGFQFYYKNLFDLATYREGYNYLAGDAYWQTKIESGGRGHSQGIELSLRKNSGSWSGFAHYTLSHTTRQFSQINNGQEYLFEFDRPHSLNTGIIIPINTHLSISLSWTYQTGLPYTPAIGRHLLTDEYWLLAEEPFFYDALIYGERNSARMRDYHRMDVALIWKRLTKKRKLPSTWSVSIYNVYNRQNPYFYYYNSYGTGEIYYPSPEHGYLPTKLYQLSLFPIIPSISYKVYFNKYSIQRNSHQKTFKQKLNSWLYYED